jgi:hypothetical protein
VASRLIPSDGLIPDTFSIELLHKPSFPNNVTNWRVFDYDQQLINFLHLKGTFKYSIIDEGHLDQMVNPDTIHLAQSNNPSSSANGILRNVVRLDKLYDIQEKFKKFIN